ncbi:MAG: 50S ribosomal protein L18 [Methanocorpusculum sp. MCE]|nr:MAG: 50S ribosomal protein L18 [Methanocorpusculum sp. MCE]
MAINGRYFVQFRRRREGRTDYYQRQRLIVSGRNRMVVRKTNRHIIIQLIAAQMDGDYTLVHVNSRELVNFGYKGYLGNTPAAYLTGMLFAVRAQKAGYEGGIADIGLQVASTGARVFAAIKGAVDAGFDVPVGEAILPDDDRCNGAHIAEYDERFAGLVENIEATKDAIMKELE